MDYEDISLRDNELAKQFELKIAKQIVRIEYAHTGNRIFLTHTEVPLSLQGQNAEEAIIEKVLQHIEAQELKLVPLCPLVKSYLRAHPEWQRLLSKGIHV